MIQRRRDYSVLECHSMPAFISGILLCYLYFSLAFYIPTLRPTHSHHWTIAMYICSLLNTGLTLTAYLRAVFTDPGPVPADWNADQQVKAPFCGKCNEFKPSRTHHCSYCRRCVLRYDHHCDWIDNCVGHVNHKLFFLFLFYINLTILHHAYLVVSLLSSIEKTSAHTHTYFWAIHAVLVCLYTMVTFPLSCFGFGFLLWCTYLIVTNQTSLENELNTNYDVGFVQNCSEVLGDNFLTWFWPSPRQLTLAMVTESRAV